MRRLLPALLLLLTVLALRLAASVCSVPSVVHYNAGNELTYWYNDANNNGSWDGNETGANYTYDIEGDRTQQIYQAQMPEPGNTTNAPYITTNTTYSYIQVGRDNFLTVANLTTGWWKSGSNKLQQVAEYSAFSYDDQGRRQFEDRYDYYDYDTDGGHTGYGTIGGNYSGTYYSYNEPVAVKLHDGVSPVRAYTLTASSTGNTGNLSVPAEDWLRGSDWGGGIGGILYSQVGFGNATTASYYHYDGRGDVVALTSNTGNVTYAAAYNAYGTHAVSLNATTNVTITGTQEVGTDLDPFRTNTREEWDSADGTAFVKEGHRIRGLETDTYLTRDPLGQAAGTNYYTYVLQDEWTKTDPLGLRDETDDEKEYVEKMTKLESDANKAGGKDDKAFAQNLGKSVKDYQKMIADVPDGAKDPVQLQAMNKALSTWVSPSGSAKYAQSSAFFSGQTVNHCNEFVYDSFSAAGVPLVGSSGYAGLKSYAATANQYGDPKKDIKGTTVTGQVTYDAKNGNGDPKDASNYTQASGQQAKPGDIIAFPQQGGAEGHVGISMGNHVYISATSNNAYKGDPQKNVVIKSDLAGDNMTIRQVSDPSKTP